MGGIYIWHNSKENNNKNVQKVFSSLGYAEGKYLDMGEWSTIVFPKTKFSINNWYTCNEGNICGIGTFSYKDEVYQKALPLIFSDAQNGKLDLSKFWGNFIIFLNIKNKYILIRDGAGLARLYGQGNNYFSSSFNGLIRCSKNKLNLNVDSVNELLSTGLITGTESLVKEIDFINPFYTSNLNNIIVLNSKSKEIDNPSNFNDAVAQQVSLIKSFLDLISINWFNYYPKSKLNLSITGGLDSRLLLGLVNKITDEYNFYTYWREKTSVDSDFRLAKEIAKFVNKPIYFKEVLTSDRLSEDRLKSVFKESFLSSDGVIRPGSFWDEEFSTIKYRENLVPYPFLRLTGFEGEQYRNMERIPMKSIRSYRSWVRWDMVFRFAGHNFKNKNSQIYLEDKIVHNLEKIVGKGHFNFLKYREYYRTNVVPSYRSLQTNIENKSGFILSPFADTNLSEPARKAFPFLKDSLQFEIEMLKRVAPDLAKLPNDYGFNFIDGEKKINVLGVKIWKSIPPSIKHKAFAYYKNHNNDSYIENLAKRSIFINSLLQLTLSTNLSVDINSIIKRGFRGKLVLNYGYFLKENERWLNW